MSVPWLTACGKALTPNERKWLRDAAHDVTRDFGAVVVIVNIGVFRCASMYCLRAGAPKARIVGIDIKKCSVPIHRELRAEFIIADSRECHKTFKEPIHLLFIDGDHHYEVVRADIANWAPKVVPGGIISFHDFAPSPKDLRKIPYLEGVRRAVTEWNERAGWIRLSAPDSVAAFRRP